VVDRNFDAKVIVQLKPFQTPNFAIVADTTSRHEPSIPLSSVDQYTLGQMCDAFRTDVFRKAGRRDPNLEQKCDNARTT
jgi:hypothetical protein